MSIQPDPPIQLDPTMDQGHQLAFINQNFLSISNFLKTNSFKIIQEGTILSPAQSIADPGAGTWGTATLATTVQAHGLSFTPALLCYLSPPAQPYIPLPYTNATFSGSAGRIWTLSVQVDSTSLYFSSEVTVLHQNFSLSAGQYSAKYYLLQETAN